MRSGEATRNARALYTHYFARRLALEALLSGVCFGAVAGIIVGFALASACGLIDGVAP